MSHGFRVHTALSEVARFGLATPAGPMTKMNFLTEPPQGDDITEYDEQNLVTYLRLLDAEAEGADWREIVRIIFEVDPDVDTENARLIFSSHLSRAHWMRDNGFRHLLQMR
jgi:hypothetical protein